MLNEVYVKEGNTSAVMGARLLFVSFTIAPKFMIENIHVLLRGSVAKTKRKVHVWDSLPYRTEVLYPYPQRLHGRSLSCTLTW